MYLLQMEKHGKIMKQRILAICWLVLIFIEQLISL